MSPRSMIWQGGIDGPAKWSTNSSHHLLPLGCPFLAPSLHSLHPSLPLRARDTIDLGYHQGALPLRGCGDDQNLDFKPRSSPCAQLEVREIERLADGMHRFRNCDPDP
ncbi:hypothetical protein FE257_007094 [Aspergillus nanangensis]|uniref:Uncharacterized protein n=1 Tax=Aspergillus nanangensis TaxID=2582783 RepID=A0AAD4GUD5_ASPNN|nr:hypothetical protein FE257_007094 [Aspergillus nanangensis]